MAGKLDVGDTQQALSVFSLSNPPPPSRFKERPQRREKEKQGRSAPHNIKGKATPVAAMNPKFETPLPQKIASTETPDKGLASTTGASNVQGPGTGAGGAGTGTGSGNEGNGPGGGGDNGVAEPPRLATPVLRGSDFPREILDQWPSGATVFVRLRVDSHGYVSECMVDRGTGVARIDSGICNLARERLRFRPALNWSGTAVAGWFGYAQPAPR